MIDPAFRARAEAALAAVEREDGVRILHAIESGSRAWGFPSRDSDYDVRFIFVRPLADYLRVSPPRDVIERPIDDLLDLGGWDLRKALGLAVRSNAVVGEWLSSPVVYRSDPRAVARLQALAREAAHGPALAYHYDRLARGAWAAGDGEIRLKSYFYALRPVLALRWLRDRGTPPPMDLPALLGGIALPDDVRTTIDSLLARKALAAEADMVPRDPALDRFVADSLAEAAPRPVTWNQDRARSAADALFRELVGGAGEQGRTAPP